MKITLHLVNLFLRQIHTNNFIDLSQVQTTTWSYLLRVLKKNKYDSFADKFHFKSSVWKRFRDDVFVLLQPGTTSLSFFLDYLNTMDKTGRIKFAMEIAGDTGLEFFDLRLKINEGKIRLNVYAKSTNSFS